MDHGEVLSIFDREQRFELDPPGSTREVAGQVVRHVSHDRRNGFISYSRLSEETAEAEIEAQLAYFRALGYEFEWKVYDHDPPADLRRRLAARGFEIEEPEALMILDLDSAPEMYWTIALPDIQRVSTRDGLAAIARMEEAVWGEDHAWVVEWLGLDLRDTPDQLSVFAIWDGDRVASAAWMYYHPPTRFASLWGGSTLPECRGRGFYTALLAVRAREARERGIRYLTVDASPMSRPILEKHGFHFFGYSTPCNWKPDQEESHA
jgi:GNAT superfamily N-acetyltransferase